MKLTQQQMSEYVQQAWEIHAEANKDVRCKYRFGQALWNILPSDVTDCVYQTNKDFYFWSDDKEDIDRIYEVCYNEFVENINGEQNNA